MKHLNTVGLLSVRADKKMDGGLVAAETQRHAALWRDV